MFSSQKDFNNHMVIDAEAIRKLDALLKKNFRNVMYTIGRKNFTQFQTSSLEKLLTEPNTGRNRISVLQIVLDNKSTLRSPAHGTILFNSRHSDTISFRNFKKTCFQYNIHFENEQKGIAFETELLNFAKTCFHSKFNYVLENIICYIVITALTAAITYFSVIALKAARLDFASRPHTKRNVFGGLLILIPLTTFFTLFHFYDNHRICTSVHFKWHKKKETDSTHKNRNAPSA